MAKIMAEDTDLIKCIRLERFRMLGKWCSSFHHEIFLKEYKMKMAQHSKVQLSVIFVLHKCKEQRSRNKVINHSIVLLILCSLFERQTVLVCCRICSMEEWRERQLLYSAVLWCDDPLCS